MIKTQGVHNPSSSPACHGVPRSSHARAYMASGAGARVRRRDDTPDTPDRMNEEALQPSYPTGADGERLFYQPSSPKHVTVSGNDKDSSKAVRRRMRSPDCSDDDDDVFLVQPSTTKSKKAKTGDEKGGASKDKLGPRPPKRKVKDIEKGKGEVASPSTLISDKGDKGIISDKGDKGKETIFGEAANMLEAQRDKIIDLESQIKKLNDDMAKVEEEKSFYAKDADNKANDLDNVQKMLADFRSGSNHNVMFTALANRLDLESKASHSESEYKYPLTTIRLSEVMRQETSVWGKQSDPNDYMDGPKGEPDDKVYDLHKYMGLHTAGRNLAIAAQNLHGEVVRTVNRMTDRYIAEEHPMTDMMSCPILKTGMPFTDPVLVGTGITFERKALEDWFQRARDEDGEYAIFRCPSTRRVVNPSDIQPNIIVKQVQEKFRDDFKKDFPTKFTIPLDFDKHKSKPILLEAGQKVAGADPYARNEFPPRSFDPFECSDRGGKISFTFD